MHHEWKYLHLQETDPGSLTLAHRKDGRNALSYISTQGAYNGSGVALASQSFDGSSYGSIVLYFQHHTGQIRSALLSSDGQWKGGDATSVVAVDAKNGTPIAAVAYSLNETARVSAPGCPWVPPEARD